MKSNPATNVPADPHRWIKIAQRISHLSPCIDAQVGAILVSGSGDVIAAGYNKPLQPDPECHNRLCKNHRERSDGSLYSECAVEHAEYRLILNFRKYSRRFYAPACSTLVVNRTPCFSCMLAIRDFRVTRVIYTGSQLNEGFFPGIQFSNHNI